MALLLGARSDLDPGLSRPGGGGNGIPSMNFPDLQPSPLWRFSLGLYRVPGMADACIRLQDGSGVDVNLLLYLLWLATAKRTVTRTEIEDIERQIAPWRDQAVIPLREVRRAIKTPPAAIDPRLAELLRTKVKALELESERLQQEALYVLAQTAPAGEPAASPEAAARTNVAAYQEVLAWPFPEDAVAVVMSAFANRGEAR
jgi:uncharacterized protein (TIGR02444 family)